MTNPDLVFVLIAGIAFLGFVLDALFDRLRLPSMLPLMAIGIALVLGGLLSARTLATLNAFIPYVSGLTIAFILFAVGLEIRWGELARVVGPATAFTLGVQSTTAVLLSILGAAAFHWDLILAFVFGFALSGPSSISVPALLRVVRMGEGLRTTLLFESVASDVLQLLVPLVLLGLYASGSYSVTGVAGALAWTVLGSAAAGIVGGIVWLAILDRLRRVTAGYTWTLTITIVLATYGLSDLIGFSPAITIFVFGVTLGNALLLDRDRPARVPWLRSAFRRFLYDARTWLHLSTGGLDIDHIRQVHREVSFFAASFFFVYLGLLFRTSELTIVVVLVPLLLAGVMLATRAAFLPLLGPELSSGARQRRAEQTVVAFNIPRGLASAVIATVPIGLGIVIPDFLDAIFFGVLWSAVVSSAGILLLYRPGPAGTPGPGEGDPRPPPFPRSIDAGAAPLPSTPRAPDLGAAPPPPLPRPAAPPPSPPTPGR